MKNKCAINTGGRIVLALFLLSSVCLAGSDWVIFKGQVNGPVKDPGGVDPAAFAFKDYSGLFFTEVYYHHTNFPDGSMITVAVNFNVKEVNIAFVYSKPGMEPFTDYIIVDTDEVKFDKKGFGYSIEKNRFRLKGDKYYIDLDLPKTKGRIEFDILAPCYTYGDGMVRYPDDDTFMFYNLPIPWARVKVKVALDGKDVELSGFGSMNHDAGVIYPGYTPFNWQAFWFFGEDHSLNLADHFTHKKFGGKLTQRLVFVDKEGRMFTSTDFELKWDEWVKAKGIPFRYPTRYHLVAEAGGAKLEMQVEVEQILLMEDLYSNLPDVLLLVAKYLTPNGWTADGWSNYTITYTQDGKTDTYKGRGIVRWTNLEEEKE